MLSTGSIGKIVRGEELVLPIVLMVQEACLLYVSDDDLGERGTASVRLRLSDSVDSFSGFVCKTKNIDELRRGVLISVESIDVESLGNNKIVCKIIHMAIVHEKKDGSEVQFGVLSSSSNRSDLDEYAMDEQLTSIHLAEVDLSTGKKYIVRGRVIYKSAVRTYDFDRHKLFYFDIMDESSTVRVKAFDYQCDRILAYVCVGEMIELSKFYVNVANKKFCQLGNDYEIVVQEYTGFRVVHDVAPIAIGPKFQFHVVGELELLKLNGLYDVIGVIKSISPSTVVHQRETFKPLSIVRLLLFDSTGSIEVNLWNEMASNFSGQKNDILAGKSFRLCVYRSKDFGK